MESVTDGGGDTTRDPVAARRWAARGFLGACARCGSTNQQSESHAENWCPKGYRETHTHVWCACGNDWMVRYHR